MIQLTTTPNHAGVTISGSAADLEQLLEAIEQVAGKENDRPAYASIWVRVAAFADQLRETLAKAGAVSGDGTPGFKTYWPEAMFVSVALNRFIKLYYSNRKDADWDKMLGRVRKFQESLVACLRRALPDTIFKPASNALSSPTLLEDFYVTQYLDELNVKFLALTKEQRLEQLANVAKRIVEQGEEYRKCKSAVLEASKRFKHPVEEIQVGPDVPEPAVVVW